VDKEGQKRVGSEMGWSFEAGASSFYSAAEERRGRGMAMVVTELQRRRGVGEDTGLFLASPRSSWWSWRSRGWEGACRRVVVSGGQWRRTSMVTTATGRARPSGVVREVADVEVRLQVQGEVEGSTESTGHGGVRSRSRMSPCVSWRAWASLGASVHVSFWPVATSTWSRACRGSFRRVRGNRLTR
jgi:hypothetical protein